MQAVYRRTADAATLLYTDVQDDCRDAVQGLCFAPGGAGYANAYPPDTPGMDEIGAQFERRDVAMARSEIVAWRGYEVRVPPVDLQLQVTRRRELTERASQIEAWLARQS
jgi:hypothetical protein